MKAAILSAHLLALIPIILAGCGPSENPASPIAESSGDIAELASEPAAEAPYWGYVFPEIDYGGYEFRITSQIFPNAVNEIVTERENGEVINDAIYKRNLIVEEKLNIAIKNNAQMPFDQMADFIKRSASASDDAFDLALCPTWVNGNISQTGVFIDLLGVETLGVRSPWWDQVAIRDVSIGGKLYFAVSNLSVQANQMPWVIYFNKTMMKDLGLEEPYELVRKGEWTLDAMLNLMKAAAQDLNGDGKFAEGDRFGFIASEGGAAQMLLIGSEIKPIAKDSDDNPALKPPSERDVTAAEKIKEMLEKTNGNFLPVVQTTECFSFMRNESMFITYNMTIVDIIRDMDDDFGILPSPKYEAQQDSYYSIMGTNTASFGIPVTAGDIGRIGVVVNALSAVSVDTVRPAYFEFTLRRKRARDDESLDMLEIISSTRVFETSQIFGWGNITSAYMDNVGNRKNESLFTVFEKYSAPAQSAIDKSLKTFMEMD